MTSVGLQQLDNGDVYSTNGTANSSSPGSLSVTGCDSAEQITKLFPKCRPRSDVNLNPVVIVRTTTANDHEDRSISRMLSPERALNSTPEPLITLQDLADTNERSVSERSTNTESREKQGHDVDDDVEDEYDDDEDDEEDDDDDDGDEDDDDEEEEEEEDDDDDDADDNNDDEETNARGRGDVEMKKPEAQSHVPDELSSEDGDHRVNNCHKDTNQTVILTHNKGGTYRLRDSRVIEIAGGREIYSQSRMKAVRKSRHVGDGSEKKTKGVWDVRSRCDSKKHPKNARDTVTETVFSTEVCSVRHHRTGNNRGTVTNNSFGKNMDSVISPSRSMAVVSCGEVVVFDDIGDNWQGLRLDLCSDSSKAETTKVETESPQPYHRNNDLYKVITSVSDLEGDSLSPEPNPQVAQVIGNLPIAVYEGSPRRYGPRQMDGAHSTHPSLPSAHSLLASPSVYPPRPGFPQRIVTTPSDNDIRDKLDPSNPPSDNNDPMQPVSSTFDYLYEFSETRKVLEEFFKCPPDDENHLLESEFQDLDYELHRQAGGVDSGSSYVGQRLAKIRSEQNEYLSRHLESPRKTTPIAHEFSRMPEHDVIEHENNFLDLSVGTGSSGDLGETEVGLQVGHSRNFTLSPETTDCDSNCGDLDSEMSLMLMENELGPSSVDLLGSSGDLVAPTDSLRLYSSMPVLEDGLSSGHTSDTDNNNPTVLLMKRQITEIEREIIQRSHVNDSNSVVSKLPDNETNDQIETKSPIEILIGNESSSINTFQDNEHDIQNVDSLVSEVTPPSPAPAPNRRSSDTGVAGDESPNRVEAAIQDIRLALQRTKTLPLTITEIPSPGSPPEPTSGSPVWIPRQRSLLRSSRDSESNERKAQSGEEACDEEEADTDLETDRLLGQHRTDDQGFYDDKMDKENKKKGRNKEGLLRDPSVLIEGVLFRARYLGSTQLVCEGQPTKSTRMMQAEEAVSRIKAPDGESQPSTEVDLFISTEKIMVLNTDLKEIMMDHALRTISYIADIGDLVVLMARRRLVPHEMEDPPKINRTPKMICHVFESEEAQFIAQSIGQAFQVAYMEFLKANGIEDHSFVKEMDYQEVLNSQEIFGDELQMFAKKEMQKEVVVPKSKGEILGVVIVESGWGSMLPTVVIANLAPVGAAARCGQLNIGDQIIAINGVSLVGLPLSTCQNYIKNSKNQTVVKLTVVPCAPVVEVKIKRPDTKYQLGFSVQNGVICSLLRGGIAERGGVRVGHRIIEINNQSVVAVPHEKIVNLLATSVGEILMKTMPTSMFRLLTGQENPVYI